MKTRRLINLDTASNRTLARIAADPTDPRHILAGVMADARKDRLAGEISSAMSLEHLADRMICRLPENLRW